MQQSNPQSSYNLKKNCQLAPKVHLCLRSGIPKKDIIDNLVELERYGCNRNNSNLFHLISMIKNPIMFNVLEMTFSFCKNCFYVSVMSYHLEGLFFKQLLSFQLSHGKVAPIVLIF